MPSPTDFNLSPYYDDFNESKKFHRILFRPSFAVQARELTQSQSILQNQVERVSDHLFKQGAMVIPGEIGYNLFYYSVKLTSFTDSAAVGVTLNDFIGLRLTGATSGVTAKVIGVDATDGTDPNTLYVKYENSGTNNTEVKFTHGETISVLTNLSGTSTTVSAVVNTLHRGLLANILPGIFYVRGFFVQTTAQQIILAKYSDTEQLSFRVGLTIEEKINTPADDTSLNDNAAGSSNENAPGAHRLKFNLTLAKKTIDSTDDTDFIELSRVINGIEVQNKSKTSFKTKIS